jgi:hypothetical protein
MGWIELMAESPADTNFLIAAVVLGNVQYQKNVATFINSAIEHVHAMPLFHFGTAELRDCCLGGPSTLPAALGLTGELIPRLSSFEAYSNRFHSITKVSAMRNIQHEREDGFQA